MVEAAEDALEYCVKEFPSYGEVGTFPTVQIKLDWQDWLNRARIDLRKLRNRSPGIKKN